MNLGTSIESVKGVGPKTAERFHAAGIETVRDLIDFLPRAYDDYSSAERIADMVPGKVTIRAHVESVKTNYIRRNMQVTNAVLVDDAGDKVQAVWFNQGYRQSQLQKGGNFYFTGDFGLKRGRYQLTSPSCEAANNLPTASDKIIPVYPVRNGLKPSLTKKVMAGVRPLITMLPETLPDDIVRRNKFISRADAMLAMHFPESRAQLEQAKRRLSFEELFSLILAARLNRNDNQKLAGYQMPFNQARIKEFVSRLPFKLTDVQRRSIWEILQDFEKPTPMNRLLQGDVGSGKTVVAAAAAYQAYVDGYQTAVMVPTEVLAKQHAETFDKLLAPFGLKIALLTGSVKGKARETLLQQISNDTVDIIIGTHALFQPTVKFHRLGFVVIDEQHRFGVKQRQDLLAKTDERHLPHLLAMTATPIPRSLQLTVFGDLDVSTLDQLPKGRQVIVTKIILPNERKQMVAKIKEELASGRQVYYVTRLIAGSAKSEQVSAEELYKDVVKSYPDAKVGILHGKMSAESKEKVMRQFEAHDLDILVSTTVIEVGVDVPNSTVMVIENADQFGLAQLHQLRGRVGRGEFQSYCFLVQSDTKQPSKRLREVERSTDGFHLAQVDLETRGAGEIYGTMQHGDLNLQIANLADTPMIHLAALEADRTARQISLDPNYLVKYSQLNHIINKYQKITTLN